VFLPADYVKAKHLKVSDCIAITRREDGSLVRYLGLVTASGLPWRTRWVVSTAAACRVGPPIDAMPAIVVAPQGVEANTELARASAKARSKPAVKRTAPTAFPQPAIRSNKSARVHAGRRPGQRAPPAVWPNKTRKGLPPIRSAGLRRVEDWCNTVSWLVTHGVLCDGAAASDDEDWGPEVSPPTGPQEVQVGTEMAAGSALPDAARALESQARCRSLHSQRSLRLLAVAQGARLPNSATSSPVCEPDEATAKEDASRRQSSRYSQSQGAIKHRLEPTSIQVALHCHVPMHFFTGHGGFRGRAPQGRRKHACPLLLLWASGRL
jgi:hypothetical protein